MWEFILGAAIATGVACIVSNEFKGKVADAAKAGKEKVSEAFGTVKEKVKEKKKKSKKKGYKDPEYEIIDDEE